MQMKSTRQISHDIISTEQTIFDQIHLQADLQKGKSRQINLSSEGSLSVYGSKATSIKQIPPNGEEEIQSIRRQYQICLQKQRELKQLIQMKFQSQILQLTTQNNILKKQVQNYKQKIKSETKISPNESACKEELIDQKSAAFYQRLLSQLEKQHSQCIINKKILLDQRETLQIKLKVIQNQNRNLESQIKQLKQEIKGFQEIKKKIKAQQGELEKTKREGKQKEMYFIKQLDQLKEEIQQITMTEKNSIFSSVNPNQYVQITNSKSQQKSLFAHNLEELIKERKINQQDFTYTHYQVKPFENSQNNNIIRRSIEKKCPTYNLPVNEDKEVINILFRKGLQFFNNQNKNKKVQLRKYQNSKPNHCNHQTTFPVKSSTSYFSQAKGNICSQKTSEHFTHLKNSQYRRYKYL